MKTEHMFYVICCNDMIKFVVTDDLKLAENTMNDLKIKHIKEIQYAEDEVFPYNVQYYWHIHDVEGIYG